MLLFGTAGIPRSSRPGTVNGVARARELKLDCLEMAWGHGVKMGDAMADRIATAAAEHEIELTAHAPYYVNLCGEAQIVAASEKRLWDAARLADRCGAKSVCFHPGFVGKHKPVAAARRVATVLRRLRKRMKGAGLAVDLRPELTGAQTQVGSFEDLLGWCESIEGLRPCIDFAHQYARTLGESNGYDAFRVMLDAIERRLGRPALDRLHVHLSGIEYGTRGERRHLPLRKSKFRYRDVMKAIADAKVSGWVICESPSQEEDALHLKRLYRRMT